MPNVTVTASSSALIEGSRTATTNGEGRYDIIDVRPGTYTVKFTANGFTTQQKAGVEVLANTSVPVNADMTVGSTGETVNVEALAAVVDTENAANHQVLTREIQDAIPAPRNMQAMGGLTPGITLRNGSGANPDVGGSQQMEQTYITGHGSNANQTTVLLDGMNINTNYLDGTIQNYVDNGVIQEATYQTSAIGAEISSGGTLVNQIPKDGGNDFHGDGFLSGTGQGSPWQANNLSQALIDRFAPFHAPPGVNAIVHIEDFNGTVGGPILKNKLWFLASGRYQSTYDTVAGVYQADGKTLAVEDQYIKQGVLRLSWQISSKDKFSGTYDRIQKFKGHELSGLAYTPNDPQVSATRRGPPLYYVAQGKWTRVQSANLLFDAGFSTDILHFSSIYLPGEEEVPFSAAWYAHVSHIDTVNAVRSVAPPQQNYYLSDKRNIAVNATYITHNHTIRVGATDAWGKNDRVSSMNGDLYELYNGTATSVQIFPTPIAIRQRQDADLGVFATDTWHIKRLSLTGGVRFEYEKSELEPTDVPAGRFVPARQFGLTDCTTVKGLGCWKTFSPRVGMVYDLFGDGKTAVKASFGTYNIPQITGYLAPFNPQSATAATIAWNDLNHDGIAQDNELGAVPTGFGLATSIPKMDPNFKREYARQFSAGFTRQIKPGYGVSFNWFRRTDHNQAVLINRAQDPVADWTPFTVTNPIDGKPLTVYNLNQNARGKIDLYETNADPSKRMNIYTGYEMSLNGKLPHNGRILTAWTIDRTTDVTCDMPIGTSLIGLLQIIGNNVTNASYNDPNSLRYCDERGLVPFRSEVKVIATMPIKWGIEGSMVMITSPETEKYVDWNLTAAARYPVDCTQCPQLATPINGSTQSLIVPSTISLAQTEKIALSPPGSRYSDRLNQLDLGLKKTFKFHEKYRIQAQADVFNVMNSSTVLVETQTLGTGQYSNLATYSQAGAIPGNYTVAPFLPGGPGGKPVSILQGRLLRLAVQLHF